MLLTSILNNDRRDTEWPTLSIQFPLGWCQGNKRAAQNHIYTLKGFQAMVTKTSILAGSYTTAQGNKLTLYDVKKSNELHQFNILYVFEGNTYLYILAGADVSSRYKFARALRTLGPRKQMRLHLAVIYKMDGVFKYSKVFQCDNGSDFKSDVTELI